MRNFCANAGAKRTLRKYILVLACLSTLPNIVGYLKNKFEIITCFKFRLIYASTSRPTTRIWTLILMERSVR